MKKKTVALLLALTALFGMGTGAFAAANNETISALLNRQIVVTYNGEEQSFVDAAGNTVYPISYLGTTYLPVRAISNLLNISVDWDGATNTVILGSDEKQPVNLVDRSNSGGTQYSWIITDTSQLSFSGSDGIQEFQNGVVWHQWNANMSYTPNRVMTFDVSGYNQISFTAAADVRSMVTLYDQNDQTITSFELQPGEMVNKTINLNGATQISFASDYPDMTLADDKDGYVYMYDPVLS